MSMTTALSDLLLIGGRPLPKPSVVRRRPEEDWQLIAVDMGAAMALIPLDAKAVTDEAGARGSNRAVGDTESGTG